jgi:hypothetical protein
MSCVLFYFFVFFLIQNKRTGGQSKSFPGGRDGTSGRKEVLGIGCRRKKTEQ